MKVLSCQREGDLGKDLGWLYRHLKECCEDLGSFCSKRNSAVYLIDIVGIQLYFCERDPDLKNYSL